MTFFIVIVIYNFREIFFDLFRPYFVRSCIIFSSKNTRAKILSLAFFFPKPFFGLFLSLLGGFYIAREIFYRFRHLSLWFRFFNLGIFYDNILGLYLSYNNMSKTIALLGLIVHFSNIRSKLEAFFSLNLNHFLNHLFLSI